MASASRARIKKVTRDSGRWADERTGSRGHLASTSSAGVRSALELDPARLAAGSPLPAQFVRNLYTDDTRAVLRRHLALEPGRVARVVYRERAVRAHRRARCASRTITAAAGRSARATASSCGRFPRPRGSARAGAQVLRHLRAATVGLTWPAGRSISVQQRPGLGAAPVRCSGRHERPSNLRYAGTGTTASPPPSLKGRWPGVRRQSCRF